MREKILSTVLAILSLISVHPADAQQAEKVFRIGLLDPSDARTSAVRLEAFWQEIRKLDGSKAKILLPSTGLPRRKVTVYVRKRRTLSVSRSM